MSSVAAYANTHGSPLNPPPPAHLADKQRGRPEDTALFARANPWLSHFINASHGKSFFTLDLLAILRYLLILHRELHDVILMLFKES